MSLRTDNLTRIASGLPRSEATPLPAAGLLREARRLFIGAAYSYSNLPASSLKAFQAVEVAVRHRVQEPADSRRTFGRVMKIQRRSPLSGLPIWSSS
jgi:hypothetical protein